MKKIKIAVLPGTGRAPRVNGFDDAYDFASSCLVAMTTEVYWNRSSRIVKL